MCVCFSHPKTSCWEHVQPFHTLASAMLQPQPPGRSWLEMNSISVSFEISPQTSVWHTARFCPNECDSLKPWRKTVGKPFSFFLPAHFSLWACCNLLAAIFFGGGGPGLHPVHALAFPSARVQLRPISSDTGALILHFPDLAFPQKMAGRKWGWFTRTRELAVFRHHADKHSRHHDEGVRSKWWTGGLKDGRRGGRSITATC